MLVSCCRVRELEQQVVGLQEGEKVHLENIGFKNNEIEVSLLHTWLENFNKKLSYG